MKYIFQFGIIAAVSFVGELLHGLLPFPVPASVYGMVLMFLLLCSGIIKLAWIEETADYLLLIMPLLFIEPSVQLMTSYDVLRGNLLLLFAVCFVSWAVVLVMTGWATQAVIRLRRKNRRKKKGQTEKEGWEESSHE